VGLYLLTAESQENLLRLKGHTIVALAAVVIIVILYATDQVAPASSAREAQLRVWLAARACGISALLLLTAQVLLGLVLSHPTNQSTWKLSKRLFPWHENLFVFTVSFVVVHVVFLVLDPYAGVGIGGALVPGLSSYRTVPVAGRRRRAVRADRDQPHGALPEAAANRLVAEDPPLLRPRPGRRLASRRPVGHR
jgi:hypothetical protein